MERCGWADGGEKKWLLKFSSPPRRPVGSERLRFTRPSLWDMRTYWVRLVSGPCLCLSVCYFFQSWPPLPNSANLFVCLMSLKSIRVYSLCSIAINKVLNMDLNGRMINLSLSNIVAVILNDSKLLTNWWMAWVWMHIWMNWCIDRCLILMIDE